MLVRGLHQYPVGHATAECDPVALAGHDHPLSAMLDDLDPGPNAQAKTQQAPGHGPAPMDFADTSLYTHRQLGKGGEG